MQIEVLNSKGEKTGRQIDLPEDIFNYEPNDHAIYLAIKQYNAAQRLGTAKTKERSEVKGSTRKLHRQKGTGGSRKGSIRNPLYRGGGTVHGPRPRDYSFKLNRKVKDLAKVSALSYKTRENELYILEDVKIEKPSTKTMAGIVDAVKLSNKKVLFVTLDHDPELYLSTRNIPNVGVAVLSDLNTYEIMNADSLVLFESAAKLFTEDFESLEA